jgi:hypothetical protein
MSATMTERLAYLCHRAEVNAQLVAMARSRNQEQNLRIDAYMTSDEFHKRANALKSTIAADIASGNALDLAQIAAALGIPPDVCFDRWLRNLIGSARVPVKVPIGEPLGA